MIVELSAKAVLTTSSQLLRDVDTIKRGIEAVAGDDLI
jgi:hypothetical protein